MKSMSKISKVAFLSIAMICGTSYTLASIEVYAEQSSNEMLKKKQKVDLKIKKLENELKELQQKLQKKVDEYKVNQQKILDVKLSIKDMEDRINNRAMIIDERMKAYQEKDTSMGPYLDAILGAKSLADVVTRTMSVRTIVEADQTLLKEQKIDKDELEFSKEELLKKKEQLQIQFQDMQDEEKELEVRKVENKAKSLKLKEQIATKKEKEKLERLRLKKEKEAAELKALAEKQFIKQQREKEQLKSKKNEEENLSSDSSEIGASNGAGNGNNGAKVTDEDQSAPSVSGSSTAKAIIAEASKYLGTSYVWGGSNPTTGFDCSGLTQWSFKQAGVTIPRTAAQQYLASEKIEASEAVAGDLVFFSYGSGVAHVGIYLGDGRMLDSQNNGVVVESLDWWNQYLVGYGKF